MSRWTRPPGGELPLRDGSFCSRNEKRATAHRFDLLDIPIRIYRGNDPKPCRPGSFLLAARGFWGLDLPDNFSAGFIGFLASDDIRGPNKKARAKNRNRTDSCACKKLL